MDAPPPYSESVPETPVSAPILEPSFATRCSYNPGVIPPAPEGDTVTFVDFLPPGSPDQNYVSFSVLLQNANLWLLSAPHWKVKICEVTRHALKASGELEGLAHLQNVNEEHKYIHGLRLWVEPRDATDAYEDIDCLTVVPKQINVVRKGKPAVRVEHLSDMLGRVKSELEINPLPGRILSLDSRKTFAPNINKFDPDTTFFREEGNYEKHYITVLRIFYQKGKPLKETIEVIDFYPTSTIKMFSDIKREAVSHLSDRAFASLSAFEENSEEDVNIRLTNIETLEVEVKPGVRVDTSRMKTCEENQRTEHVRFLRAVSVKRPGSRTPDSTYLKHDSSCKTFIPILLQGSSTAQGVQVESVEKTKERIEAWIKATGAEVLCAETVQLRSAIGDLPETISEKSDVQALGTYQWLTAFRLYLNGKYAEPHSDMLPALPTNKSGRKEGCVIS